jgi:hypothetical protein
VFVAIPLGLVMRSWGLWRRVVDGVDAWEVCGRCEGRSVRNV